MTLIIGYATDASTFGMTSGERLLRTDTNSFRLET